MAMFPKMLEHDRKQADWSVGQAAWGLGVSTREYRELEAGSESPNFEMWDRICKLYGWPQTLSARRWLATSASVTPVNVQVSTEVTCPVAQVWRFYAVEHVRNHPRWDPDMQLEQLSDGPIGLGTRIRRLNTRWNRPIEGEMEVVEFDSERALSLSIHDPNMEAQGRVTFEALGPARTRTLLTVTTGVEGMDEPEKLEFLTRMMQRSIDNVKRLIETEIASAEER